MTERGRNWAWSLTEALISYGVSLVGFAAFVAVETRYRDSALPLRLLFSLLGDRVSSAYAEATGDPVFQGRWPATRASRAALVWHVRVVGKHRVPPRPRSRGRPPVPRGVLHSLGTIFFVAAAMALGFLVTLLLPELPLRTASGEVRSLRRRDVAGAHRGRGGRERRPDPSQRIVIPARA